MDSGRIPACVVDSSLGGGNNTSGNEVLIGRNNSDYYPSMQEGLKGNRCGHDKNSFKKPTFYESSRYKGRRSNAIKSACDIIDDITGFKSGRDGRNRFKQLLRDRDPAAERLLALFENKELARLFQHFTDADEISRSIRSERVESTYALVTRTIINGIDLRTMAFGFWDHKANRQVYFNYDDIAGKTGLTKSRIQRAITLLKKLGLVTVNRVVQTLDDGRIIHKDTQIFLSDNIFLLFGLQDEMLSDRKDAIIKWQKERDNIEKRQKYLETYRPSIKSPKSWKQKQTLTSGVQSCIKRVPTATRGHGVEIRDKINQLVHSGKTLTEAFLIVKQQYPPPH